jgi:hypothetical protein
VNEIKAREVLTVCHAKLVVMLRGLLRGCPTMTNSGLVAVFDAAR